MHPHPPGWYCRIVLRDALAGIGLPFVAEAVWRSPSATWMALEDRLQAVAVACEVTAAMRRRITVGERLRRAVFDAVVAGMAELRRRGDGDPLLEAHRPVPTGPSGPSAPACDPGAPLVIRRRGEEGRIHA